MSKKAEEAIVTEVGSGQPKQGVSVFDNIDKLRLRQDFDRLATTRRVLATVPVGKPGKQTWFRIRPGPEWQLTAWLLEWEEDGSQYFMLPHLAEGLEGELKRANLRLVVTPAGSVRLWPIRQPNADGTDNPWFQSARRIAALAEQTWVRMRSDREAQGYTAVVAEVDFDEPIWPEQSFQELLKIAFAGKVVEGLDHPVVQRLLGRRQ